MSSFRVRVLFISELLTINVGNVKDYNSSYSAIQRWKYLGRDFLKCAKTSILPETVHETDPDLMDKTVFILLISMFTLEWAHSYILKAGKGLF